MAEYPFHEQAIVHVRTSPATLFQHLDDQAKLGVHMEKPSMMMLGGRMTYEFDAGQGRAIGSVIKMGGTFLGLTLMVEEAITERTPPRRKTWETQGATRILIIDRYLMGFEIEPEGDGSRLCVFIDYSHPSGPMGRILGFLFARIYARWCVTRMASDAARRFGSLDSSAAISGARPYWRPAFGAVVHYTLATLPLFALWEIAQLPLYTIWEEEGVRASLLAALHCTAGDALLAFSSLLGAMALAALSPTLKKSIGVMAMTILLGMIATAVIEMVSTQWLQRWAYGPLMPVDPVFGIGLSPLAQWFVVPAIGLYFLRRRLTALSVEMPGSGGAV
jgi:hypothetical protein